MIFKTVIARSCFPKLIIVALLHLMAVAFTAEAATLTCGGAFLEAPQDQERLSIDPKVSESVAQDLAKDFIRELEEQEKVVGPLAEKWESKLVLRRWVDRLMKLNYGETSTADMKRKQFLFKLDNHLRLNRPRAAIAMIRKFMFDVEQANSRLILIRNGLKYNRDRLQGPNLAEQQRARSIWKKLADISQIHIGAGIPLPPKNYKSLAEMERSYNEHLRYMGKNWPMYSAIRVRLENYVRQAEKLTGTQPSPLDLSFTSSDALTDVARGDITNPLEGLSDDVDLTSIAKQKSLVNVRGRAAATVLFNTGVLADRDVAKKDLPEDKAKMLWQERPDMKTLEEIYQSEPLARIAYLKSEFKSELWRSIQIPIKIAEMFGNKITQLKLKGPTSGIKKLFILSLEIFFKRIADLNLILRNIEGIEQIVEHRAARLEEGLLNQMVKDPANVDYEKAKEAANILALHMLDGKNTSQESKDEFLYAFARVAEFSTLWNEMMVLAKNTDAEGQMFHRMEIVDKKARDETRLSVLYSQTSLEITAQTLITSGIGAGLYALAPFFQSFVHYLF